MPETLHRDTRGRDALVCRKCGARFPEAQATTDGWHFECPECGDAEGIGEGLRRVRRDD
jgi:predicted RNA-binding Zn-ribbon protein involved in translation (DUF1610 family)